MFLYRNNRVKFFTIAPGPWAGPNEHMFDEEGIKNRFLLPSTEGLRTYSEARSASVAIFEEIGVDCPIHWVITLARPEVSIVLCLPCVALVFDCSLFLFESLNGFFREVAHTREWCILEAFNCLLSFTVSIL